MKFTQKEMVLRHLENIGSITSKEAFEKYGITRLSSIIFNLRERGYNITTEIIAVPNRYGDKCYVAEYTLGD